MIDRLPFVWQLSLPLALGGLAIAIVYRGRSQVQGTTLVGPWYWIITSIASVTAAQTLVICDAAGALLVQQAANCSIVCPVVSLLGAKRPQDIGWHFVVASLWLVLVLPVLEAAVLHPGQPPDVRGLRTVFLAGLIVLGVLNGLPTRYWPAHLLFGSAQTLLLADYLPWPALLGGRETNLPGLSLLALSLVVASWQATYPKKSRSSLDRLWRDFRDAYGLLWSLRVAEQVNKAASRYGWGLRLGWNGFVAADGGELRGSLPPTVEPVLVQNLQNLLRRFVSPDWIAQRLSRGVN